jgi:hypothetical protein
MRIFLLIVFGLAVVHCAAGCAERNPLRLNSGQCAEARAYSCAVLA